MKDKGLEIALKLKAQIEGSLGSKFKEVYSKINEVSNASQKLGEKAEALKKFEKSSEGLKKLGKEFGTAKLKVKELQDEINQAAIANEKIAKTYSEVSNQVKKLEGRKSTKKMAELELARKNLQKLQQQMDLSNKKTLELEKAHKKASAVVERLDKKIGSQKTSFNKYRMTLEKLKIPLKNYRQELKKTEYSIEQLALKQKLANKISKAKENIKGAGAKVLSTAKKGAFAVGATAVLGIGLSADSFISFEKQMRRVEAISGATKEQFNKLKNEAINLGSSTVFTAEQAAAGMEKFALAGFKVDQIIDVMPGVLKLTAASGEDLSSVADIISDNLIPFKMGAKDVDRFADVLANTMSRTNVNVGMLGESLKYVAGSASSLDLSLEATTAVLGLMGDQAIKSGQAGTNLKAAFSNIANPKVQKSLKAFGINVKNSKNQFVGLLPLLEQLEKKTSKMSGIDRLAFLKENFGEEGSLAIDKLLTTQKEFNGVVLTGSKAVAAMIKENENAKGTASRMADVMLQGAQGAQVLLSSSIDGLKIVIGELFFNPTMLKGMKKITEFISELGNVLRKNYNNNSLNKSLKKIFSWIHNLYVRLDLAIEPLKKLFKEMVPDGDILSVLGKFIKNFSDALVITTKIASRVIVILVKLGKILRSIINVMGADNIFVFVGAFMAIGKAVGVLAAIRGKFVALGLVVNSVGGIIAGIKTLLLTLGGPVVWIGAAIALAGYLIYKNWDKIKPVLLVIWQNIKAIWELCKQWVNTAALVWNFLNPVKTLVELAKSFYSNWDSSLGLIENLKNGFFGFVDTLQAKLNGIIESFTSLGDKFVNIPIIRTIVNKFKADGSHKNGLDYVPYDGYIAELHKGERVLTAEENKGTLLSQFNSLNNSSDRKPENPVGEITIKIDMPININGNIDKESLETIKEQPRLIAKEIERILKELGIKHERTQY